MSNGRNNPVASLGINTHFSGSSVSSGNSPLNSPLLSPVPPSPSFDNPHGWDPTQFNQHMSLQPPLSPNGSVNSQPAKSGNTFVHKLYNMVVDTQYQHLIAWTYTGISFIVCNITEFSRDVLPKHFKHNNFSSFVRQLNMYGFHKVNKSPRGHRTLAENQIWEFSHPKFLRNRPDLLDEIKRKALENDSGRREATDINSHMSMMQMSQSDMMQQISQLQENLSQVMNELSEAKKRQNAQQQMMKDMIDFMSKQYGPLPFQDMNPVKDDPDRPPPIFITSADNNQLQQNTNYYLNVNEQQSSPKSPISAHSSPRINPHTMIQNENSNSSSSSNSQFNVQQQLSVHHFSPQQMQPTSPTFMQNNNQQALESIYNSPRSPLLNPQDNYLMSNSSSTTFAPPSPHNF